MEYKYDVFISYRREGGYDTAKHLNDLLVRDGYKVSFDIDTLRSGDFDTQLLTRIEHCKDFILIVDKHCFDRTLDSNSDPNKDWLRQELAHALKHNKNIIPIFLSDVSGFPEGLPKDIVKVTKKNGPEYNKYYFNDFYKKLCSRFLKSRKKSFKKFILLIVFLLCLISIACLLNNYNEEEEDVIYYVDHNVPHTTNREEFELFVNKSLKDGISNSGFSECDSILIYQKWEKEAISGSAISQWLLGLAFFEGYVVIQDRHTAISWFEKSANQDNKEALYALGACHKNGICVKENLELAEAYYKKSAGLGFAPAQNDYAILVNSNGNINTNEAIELFQKAAMQNYAPAQYNLAFCYVKGVGVSPDFDKAIEWLEKSANQNYVLAKYNLGSCYITGPEWFKDYETGIEILQQLSYEEYAPALHDLSQCYGNGIGVDKDIDKGVELMQKAANLDYAPALTTLGVGCFNPPANTNLKQDFNKGLEYLYKAAAQGFPLAQYYIGWVYQGGYGVEKNHQKAQTWFNKAAKQGVTHQMLQNLNQQMIK